RPPALPAPPPHRVHRGPSPGKEAGAPEHGGRVEAGGTGAQDDLEVFARIEGAARLEQHAPQFVPQVMKRGSQGKRLLVLPDRLRQAAGPEVRIAQGSVLVGQFGGDMGREALAWLAPDLGGAPE